MKTGVCNILKSLLIAGILTLLHVSQVHAVALTLGTGSPDLLAQDTSIQYDYTAMCQNKQGSVDLCGGGFSTPDLASSGGVLTIDGTYFMVLQEDSAGAEIKASGVTFSLTANFDGSGLFDVAGSSFLMTGTSTLAGFNSGTFVSADLFNFGFAGDGTTGGIQFEFNNIFGDFAAFGDVGGMYINMTGLNPGFSGTWDWDDNTTNQFFMTDFVATADVDAFMPQVAVVPVPAALWLFASGLLSVVGVARRRKR